MDKGENGHRFGANMFNSRPKDRGEEEVSKS